MKASSYSLEQSLNNLQFKNLGGLVNIHSVSDIINTGSSIKNLKESEIKNYGEDDNKIDNNIEEI